MSEETLIAECTLCATYYKTFRKLRRHFKKRHADVEVLQCYFCDYITHDKIMFKEHKETLHADEKFVCGKCYFKTRKWTRIERHFDKHKAKIPVTELPSYEDLSSTSRVKEAVHSTSSSRVKEAVQKIIQKLIKEEKIEEKLFICDFCDKHFPSKIRLKQHVQVHSLENPFKCTLWKDEHKTKSINEISSLEHLNLSGAVNESDHSIYSVKETVQEIIEEIKKQEMGRKGFVCQICKKRFLYKSNLTYHSKVHTQEFSYKCTLCDYAGKWKGYLAVHIQSHFDERPFKCSFCEYRAKKAQHLKGHIKVHLNKRDFACEICDYKTFTKQFLQLHIRVHTGEKTFICQFCERGFSQRSNLKSHLRRIHQVLSNMNHSNRQRQKAQS